MTVLNISYQSSKWPWRRRETIRILTALKREAKWLNSRPKVAKPVITSWIRLVLTCDTAGSPQMASISPTPITMTASMFQKITEEPGHFQGPFSLGVNKKKSIQEFLNGFLTAWRLSKHWTLKSFVWVVILCNFLWLFSCSINARFFFLLQITIGIVSLVFIPGVFLWWKGSERTKGERNWSVWGPWPYVMDDSTWGITNLPQNVSSHRDAA